MLRLLMLSLLLSLLSECFAQRRDSTQIKKIDMRLTPYEKRCYFIGIPVGTFTFCVTVVLFEKIKLKRK